MNDPYNKHPNAQRWTAEAVTEHLHEIEKDATDGPSLFLGKALAKRGLYRHIWPYWKRTFLENEDIIERMLRIETILEAKIIEGAMKKELSSTAAALTLKFNYRWNERSGGISTLITKNYPG
jgi:hypothetical protein